jgi:hypothetical protein
MATDLKSNTEGLLLTRFWGGENRGACVQVTSTNRNVASNELFQYVTLSREEARTLANDLLAFANKREVDKMVDA